MKLRFFLFCIMQGTALLAVVDPRGPRTGHNIDIPTFCDQSYALNMRSILIQFAGSTPKDVLKAYLDYMIRVKQFEDLTFQAHAVESQFPNLIAQLRTPSTKYTDCRVQRVTYPKSVSGDICDQTYAAYMQHVLKQIAPSATPEELQVLEQHMVRLKHLADTQFAIQAFEHATNLETYSALRGPAVSYLDCRDASIRITSRIQ